MSPSRTFTRTLRPRAQKHNAQNLHDYVENTSVLPNEIMIEIFSYLTTKDLFYNASRVCNRWEQIARSPVLWKKIVINDDIPTEVLISWIKRAPLLSYFSAENRYDIEAIFQQLSKYCRNLESIKIQNCWGSLTNCTVHCRPLCNLASRCHNLRNIHLDSTIFYSCKFFRIISSNRTTGKIVKRCNYIGPMNPKQLKAFFSTLKESDFQKSATIGSACYIEHKYRIQDVIRKLRQPEEVDNIIENLWNDLIYNQNSLNLGDFTDDL